MTTMTAMQYLSLIMAAAGIARIIYLMRHRRAAWWYIAPALVLAEIVAFYIHVLFFGGFGSVINANISATIRNQGVSLFVLYLFLRKES